MKKTEAIQLCYCYLDPARGRYSFRRVATIKEIDERTARTNIKKTLAEALKTYDTLRDVLKD